jgi:hypothetical protein
VQGGAAAQVQFGQKFEPVDPSSPVVAEVAQIDVLRPGIALGDLLDGQFDVSRQPIRRRGRALLRARRGVAASGNDSLAPIVAQHWPSGAMTTRRSSMSQLRNHRPVTALDGGLGNGNALLRYAEPLGMIQQADRYRMMPTRSTGSRPRRRVSRAAVRCGQCNCASVSPSHFAFLARASSICCSTTARFPRAFNCSALSFECLV